MVLSVCKLHRTQIWHLKKVTSWDRVKMQTLNGELLSVQSSHLLWETAWNHFTGKMCLFRANIHRQRNVKKQSDNFQLLLGHQPILFYISVFYWRLLLPLHKGECGGPGENGKEHSCGWCGEAWAQPKRQAAWTAHSSMDGPSTWWCLPWPWEGNRVTRTVL